MRKHRFDEGTKHGTNTCGSYMVLKAPRYRGKGSIYTIKFINTGSILQVNEERLYHKRVMDPAVRAQKDTDAIEQQEMGLLRQTQRAFA
ncbi:hypothetical protein [Vibrio agarivorans]|uniref:hypothetical protein n=1 Tax=Vibrio agarivorans TaxID=153622 RepID=UPI0025B549E1|nr:hypothetical protein [Vibrio agarivorans]MDN3659961.1 hypothetical protein [Vibrio agarivorans]